MDFLEIAASIVSPRASKLYIVYAGSKQRRYYCSCCRALIDTDCSDYPETKHAEEAIETHLQMHVKNKTFPIRCGFCNINFDNLKELRNHLSQNHKGKTVTRSIQAIDCLLFPALI